MRRTRWFVLLFACLLVVSACGGKKPPDPSAIKGKGILSVLRDMTKAYGEKSLDSFMANVSDDYPDRNGFSAALASVFANHDTVHFNVQYTKMLILVQDKGRITVSCNWDAEWLARGTTRKGGGRITFAFDGVTLKLVAIEGKNPFIPPAESTVKP